MSRARAALLIVLVTAVGAAAQDAPNDGAPPAEPAAPALDPPRLVGPRTGADRKKALLRYGGNDATEKAVAAGLAWLARHQEESGLWDADAFDARCEKGSKPCDGRGKGQHGEDVPCPFDDAISALALLAFLGDGHLPDPPEGAADPYAPVVKRAVAALETTSSGWAFPIVTEALAELEAMERKGLRREAVRRNAERLLGARDEDGAWGYWGRGSDVPFATFCVSAAAAVRDGGAEVPDDLGKGVDRWLSSLEESKGKLAYRIDGREFGYTPTSTNAHCAVAMRELLGAGLDGARHRAHLALLAGQLPVWKISLEMRDVPGRGKQEVQIGHLSMFEWWAGTVGQFQRGGDGWTTWFGSVKSALVPNQRKDGCARGSWDPKGWYERRTGGRVFATALGVLMLEQPYRHRRIRG
jgi:hypothetical protein